MCMFTVNISILLNILFSANHFYLLIFVTPVPVFERSSDRPGPHQCKTRPVPLDCIPSLYQKFVNKTLGG